MSLAEEDEKYQRPEPAEHQIRSVSTQSAQLFRSLENTTWERTWEGERGRSRPGRYIKYLLYICNDSAANKKKKPQEMLLICQTSFRKTVSLRQILISALVTILKYMNMIEDTLIASLNWIFWGEKTFELLVWIISMNQFNLFINK